MSWGVDLCHADDQLCPTCGQGRIAGDVLSLAEPHGFTGGTYAPGPQRACHLNVTYNYHVIFGSLIRELDGRLARDTIGELAAFAAVSDPPDQNVWNATRGNAAVAVRALLVFARAFPEGRWHVR